jgi:hypothetical protein
VNEILMTSTNVRREFNDIVGEIDDRSFMVKVLAATREMGPISWGAIQADDLPVRQVGGGASPRYR